MQEIGHHEIFFAFQFDEKPPLYFLRKTDDPDNVISCDKERHTIEVLPISKFQRALMENYGANRTGISMSDISDHFFRIYRRTNVLEQFPLGSKPSEMAETTVNFLIKLFRHAEIINKIQSMAKELHVDISKVRSSSSEPAISQDEIDALQITIDSLKKRLQENMEKNEVAQMHLFGYSPTAMATADKIRKELTMLADQESNLKAQLTAIQGSMDIQSSESAEDFEDLQTFFPEITLKKFEDIDNFHQKIRSILLSELEKEERRLKTLLEKCQREINRLQKHLKESDVAKKMSVQLISECASLMNSISKYEADQKQLIDERERQRERDSAKKQVLDLLKQEKDIIETIESSLNSAMIEINSFLSGDMEIAPSIHIDADKSFSFGIRGNSSEGAAFRGMVVYDLAILKLCGIPALIHDSNILKKIDNNQFERLLDYYDASGQQIFIAYDRLAAATEKARKRLLDCAALTLSDEDLLFGRPWSKKNTGGNP